MRTNLVKTALIYSIVTIYLWLRPRIRQVESVTFFVSWSLVLWKIPWAASISYSLRFVNFFSSYCIHRIFKQHPKFAKEEHNFITDVDISNCSIADRGCLIINWTGLNIKIGICSSKSIWVTKLVFCRNDSPTGDHFGKRTAWSLIYFLNYAYFDI